MRLDVSQWENLGRELARVTNNINDPLSLRSHIKAEGEAIKKTWRDDARVKSGRHGKHYPNSITYETRTTGILAVEAVVGPDPSMPQGGMSFEFGSRNQPPHLSGQLAAQEAEGRIVKRMNDWLDGVGL